MNVHFLKHAMFPVHVAHWNVAKFRIGMPLFRPAQELLPDERDGLLVWVTEVKSKGNS